MSYFNAPIRVPKGSGLGLQNTSSETVTLVAPSAFTGGNYTLILPVNAGTNGYVLTTNGSNTLSWSAVSASSVTASGITLGDDNVTISTSAGNVVVNAPTGQAVQLRVADTNVAVFSGTTATLSQATRVLSTTESTSTTTGALIVDGGVGITSNVKVGGNVAVTGLLVATGATDLGSTLDVAGATELASTLDVTGVVNINNTTESVSTSGGALVVDGGLGVAKSAYIGSNLVVSKRFVLNVDTFIDSSNVSGAPLALLSDALTKLATIKHIRPPSNETHYYHANTANIATEYVTGQAMDILFTRPTGNTLATANIDFGSSNLYTGSGTARYLVFTQPGQSASLVYIAGSDELKGWRILNSGAQVF